MNGLLRLLIIEDEFLIALNLKEILTKENFEIVGIANSYEESIHLCKNESPDIALVDINIDGHKDGIETASFLKEVFDITIIFITAYTDDNIFERAKIVQPAAYLTKPFDSTNVIRTVKICGERISSKQKSNTVETSVKQLILNTGDGWHKVLIDDIIYISSDNNYCTFYLSDGSTVMVHKSLKHYEVELSDLQFYRCHQSYLISMSKLLKIEKKEGVRAILQGGHVVPVARNRRPELMDLFLQ